MASAALLVSSLETWARSTDEKKLKVAVNWLRKCQQPLPATVIIIKLIEVVSLCDIKYDRAINQNKQYKLMQKRIRTLMPCLRVFRLICR
jgi:hypothetical protein